jgi:hypothetical protein
MAQALLVSINDIKRYSKLSGNIDEDKIIQFVKIAQDIHIEQYLGTDLLNRLEAGIIADDLTANETSLINNYVKPMLIHWALVEYLPNAAYDVSNRGVFKNTSETGETLSKEEVDFMIEKQRNLAEYYTRRFIDYMCYNQTTFPQYNSNTNEDITPTKDSSFSGWVI